jgi:hypothetical protein
VPLLHLKDMASDRSFAEVGDGTLDLPAIFAAAEYPRGGSGGARWYVVEHDHPTMPSLESAPLAGDLAGDGQGPRYTATTTSPPTAVGRGTWAARAAGRRGGRKNARGASTAR